MYSRSSIHMHKYLYIYMCIWTCTCCKSILVCSASACVCRCGSVELDNALRKLPANAPLSGRVTTDSCWRTKTHTHTHNRTRKEECAATLLSREMTLLNLRRNPFRSANFLLYFAVIVLLSLFWGWFWRAYCCLTRCVDCFAVAVWL